MSKSVRAMLLLGLFVIVCLPVLAYARKGSSIFSRFPEFVKSHNSQTMALLEAPRNSDPVPKGGGQIAIVDNSALSVGVEPDAYVDGAKGSNGKISVYIVREGDTLGQIADMYDVTTNTIIWANDLRGSTVRPGQELVILPVSGVRHVVKSGETLQSITSKYKGDVDDILSYNGLKNNSKLAVGDVVIIPNGSIVQASSGSSKPTAPSAGKAVGGYFIKPVSAIKTQGIHGHNGVDFGGPIGTSIKAAAGGTVTVARSGGYNGGYGNYVVISHGNGTQTLYAHMNSVGVSVGQKVGQGEKIGTIGNTGKSTGPHLHFEVRGARNPF